MSKIIVIASFYPKEDQYNSVKEILLSMINPTRLEEGKKSKFVKKEARFFSTKIAIFSDFAT